MVKLFQCIVKGMASGEEFKAQIERIVPGGAGLARIGGKSVFIDGTAPGETVRCRITEEHASWARAELLEIIRASPDRAASVCAFYGICGGCDLQHIRYEAQLAAKAAILREVFARIAGIEAPPPLIVSSAPWEYRNRMQFHRIDGVRRGGLKVRPAGLVVLEKRPTQKRNGISRGCCKTSVLQQQPLKNAVLQPVGRKTARACAKVTDFCNRLSQNIFFGLKARASDEVIPVTDCPVADPGIRAVLRKAAGGEPALMPPPGKNRFTVYARDGLLLSEGPQQRGRVRLGSRKIALDAEVFFQSNGAMLERLIEDLREIAAEADKSRPMADLFCGVGTFAMFLAEMFPAADLVEENKTAIALARENMRSAGGTEGGTEFFALRTDDWVKARARSGYGFIVADPPRQGLSRPLAYWLAEAGPPLFAYVSCDPATLARDSGILLGGGYALRELRFYDFYPQTAHIETLAIFNKNKNK
jgi:23S rRNA (uracil1939-C5)-methyltransferase